MKKKFYWFKIMIVMCLAVSVFSQNAISQPDWKNDFRYQELKNRPDLEVRYKNTNRDEFEISAAAYHLTGDLVPPNMLYDTNTAKPWLWFEMTDQQGNLFTTRDSRTKSRINLYRRGPYYCEIHWVDVRFANQKGDTLPVRGEVVLYCFPERIKSSVKLYVTGNAAVKSLKAKGIAETSFPVKSLAKGEAQNFNFNLYNEEKPLPDNAFTLKKGTTPVQYDNRKGVYTIGSETVEGFQRQYFDSPNGYEDVAFKVKNDGTARKIYICHKTLKGEGIVEGGVVLDETGHPLPILVQVCKNFAGEKEERFYNPRDTAFSETYFPLYLEPNEELEISSLHVYQNWGRHMTKHWSSLGFFMDYFHSSTGVTETTCYIPFKFGHKTGIMIGDFRAMSQKTFWSGQPQHDNVAGHNFLTFYDGKQWNYSEYRGTTYKSTGANWCNVEMEYLSSDSSIQLLLNIWEVPQDDELRSFFTARYKVLKPLTVNDAKANFRFLDINTSQQSLRYKNYAYCDGSGKTITKPLEFGPDPFCVKGIEIPSKNSFAAVFGEKKGSNGIMIRSFESNSGVRPAFSIQHKAAIPEPKDTTVNELRAYTPPLRNGDTRFSLVPSTDRLELKAGDEITIDGFWLPYGEYDGVKTPEREIIRFGKEEPKVVAVKKGAVLQNFPTIVQVENNRAEFSIKGGFNIIPVIAKGLTDYHNPMLYRKIDGIWLPEYQNQNSASDGMQLFCDKDGKFGAVLLLKTNGEEQEIRITSGEKSVLNEKVKVMPVSGKSALLKIAKGADPSFVTLKIDPGTQFNGPVEWKTSEGNSVWFRGESKKYFSGLRVTGFENQAMIQYWWQPSSSADTIRTPEFEMKTGWNLSKPDFRVLFYQDGSLKTYDAKKAPKQDIAGSNPDGAPGIVILWSPKLNQCKALAFKEAQSIGVTNKNSVSITMKPQLCNSGRRKVMTGNYYQFEGNPETLIQMIEQDLAVK